MKTRKLNKEIKRWIRYLKRDNYHNWDWAYMLGMEIEKMKQMAEFFDSDDCHVMKGKDVANRIRLAIKLATIALDEGDTFKGYVNTRNAHRFISLEYVQSILELHEKHKLEDSYLQMYYNEIRVAKAWFLYNKIRFYNMKNWWD